jgi:glycosyltransferase involved in cell wall biosynthesis
LPNIPFVAAGQRVEPPPVPRDSNVVLLVASLGYKVNLAGLERFIASIWPQIRAAVPDAIFRIVGSGLTEEMKRRWSAVDGVVPIGYVDDLRTAYAEAAFTIVPIFEGGGTKIKVVESLLYGRTAVVASHAHRGFEDVLKPDEALVVGDDASGLAKGAIELLRNRQRRNRLAQKGHLLVQQHYSFDLFKTVVESTVERVLSRTAGVSRRIR